MFSARSLPLISRTRTLSLGLLAHLLLLLAGCAPQASPPATPPQNSTENNSAAAIPTSAPLAPVELLNVANDPTRELWKEINAAFIADHKTKTGQDVTIKQSHGASGSQARAVIDGLQADVATLALWPDTDALRKKGLLRENWENELPNRSLAFSSVLVFVVRKGNPKQIKDWPDLIKPDVVVITPNPKTSGNGKISFLSAWGSVTKNGGTADQARTFVTELYKHVPVLDTGARGATTTFAQKEIGDVHLTFESEAHLELKESAGELEIVFPPLSFLHEPHIALIDANVDPRGTREIARKYLEFLYTPAGQDIIANNFYRPVNPDLLAKLQDRFPPVKTFTLTDLGTNWDDAQKRFFLDGGLFDEIYQNLAQTPAAK